LLCLAVEPSSGVIGVIDDVPAATLLVPYFQVDLDACGASGATTELTVSNTSAASVVAHLTLWTDLSVPVLNFDLHVPASSSVPVDVGALLCQGSLPQTSPPTTGFPNCATFLPPPANLSATLIDHLQKSTTGRPSAVLGNQCAGADHGDHVSRGYLTIDSVNTCTVLFPSSFGYSALLAMDNRLAGTFRLVDPARGLDLTAPAVAIEADPPSFDPGDPTFYARYTGSLDEREPLPGTVSAPYNLSPTLDTRFLMWRDGPNQTQFACATPPAPLSSAAVLVAPADSSTDENLSYPVPFEANAFDFSDLGAAAGLDGSSSGRVTFTLPSQAWIVGNGTPASANLTISKTDGVTVVTVGGELVYTIVAGNLGPSDVGGATVSDVFPSGLSCTWTCQGAAGGTCPANGTGNVLAAIDLPVGGTATFSAHCTLAAGVTPGTQIVNVATIAPPDDAGDPDATSNGATDTTVVTAPIPVLGAQGLGLLVALLALVGVHVVRRRAASA
jgi:uncharacterized repeat protein (TIGR01451 family)